FDARSGDSALVTNMTCAPVVSPANETRYQRPKSSEPAPDTPTPHGKTRKILETSTWTDEHIPMRARNKRVPRHPHLLRVAPADDERYSYGYRNQRLPSTRYASSWSTWDAGVTGSVTRSAYPTLGSKLSCGG